MPETPSDPHTRRAPYMRVRDALIAEIEAGTYEPGDRIPSESDLSAAHGVAPMTARRAVQELRERGLVYTEWGKGSFVVDRPTEDDGQGEA
ncbi:GntR family transcriptional regulator [Streptomyces qinzhouensis]|uniref:GntR family transcriptional regulator n=1 Tax=Streptomyces qinzhouensis TaxID=2599401 RepID=A0A5B8IQD4_9ACTN|nr:GntR family transcriptional regulator [Streptomyces qinzhouensis]QDY79819.1 GntR family transcriptional regulator [Streptomyces qinzhouensis]